MQPNSCQVECRGLTRELYENSERSKQHTPASKITLLDDISFQVPCGQVLAVLGRSGAGKSTLLRLLNRLDEPTAGTVFLNGTDYRTLAPRELRRRVGMIMQRAYLFPGSVAENVCFGPKQHGIAFSNSQVQELLEQVGLSNYSGRDVATLSGGEAQRVAITRALANSPELLLLDEPTSALDPAAKQDVESLLESLIRRRKLTCIWVTHDAAQAGRMADSVLVLEAARRIAFGPADTVLAEQADEQAAQLEVQGNA